MNTIKTNHCEDLPDNFTGIVQKYEGKFWYKNGKYHREDGPAVEYSDGYKMWFLEDKRYMPKNLNNFIVLDYDKGKYDLIWYRLLGKDKILEYPDIPGLITK